MKTPDSGEVGFKAGNASKKLHLFQALRFGEVPTGLFQMVRMGNKKPRLQALYQGYVIFKIIGFQSQSQNHLFTSKTCVDPGELCLLSKEGETTFGVSKSKEHKSLNPLKERNENQPSWWAFTQPPGHPSSSSGKETNTHHAISS